MDHFQLLALITTPKLAEKATEILKSEELPLQYRFSAEGTASSEIIDMLGLGNVDKSVILSMIPKQFSEGVLQKLHTDLRLDTVNSGIAFTIPLSGANSLILRMLTESQEHQTIALNGEEETIMTENKHALIVAIVNQGFSGDVMEAVRPLGAKGGTVIRSHQIGNEEVAGFWGMNAKEEKEIVMILSEMEHKVEIMKGIGEHCGMHSDAQGIVMSLPIDSVTGM